MPITQERMLRVLDESEDLDNWARDLRRDLLAAIHSPMSDEAKMEAITLLLEAPVPACVQSAIERDHFRRTRRRNEKSAQRMRLKRTGTGTLTEELKNGLG